MVRNLRLLRGLRQDELAAELRDAFGLDWTQATIAAIETGRRQLRLDEVPMVCAVLRCRYVDLFRGGGPVKLANGVTAQLPDVQNVLQRDNPSVAPADLGWKPPKMSREAYDEVRERTRILPRLARGTATIGEIVKASKGEAEQKAARKLGVDPEVIATAALGTWKCSLTQQRDAVVVQRAQPDASPRTLQAMRGRVTRELVEELRERIEEAS